MGGRSLWVQPGDLLIERSNTIHLVGTTRLYKGEADFAIFPDLLIRARIVPEVPVEFVEVVFGSTFARSYLRSRAKGISGSMPKIDQGTIEELPVPVPPLAEQRRIVAEADRHMSLIEAAETTGHANLKRSERLRQAIVKRAFEGKVVPQDSSDEPASMLLERIQAERVVDQKKRPVRRSRSRVRPNSGSTQGVLL